MSDMGTSSASPGSLAVLEHVAYGPHNATNPRPDSQSLHPIPALVRELFQRARDARLPLMPQWRRNYRHLNNRDWRPGATSWEEEPAVSQIWPVVASSTAWLTDQRPTISVTPTAEAFSEYWDYYNELAGDLNTCITAAFQAYSLEAEIMKAWWDTYTYSVGYVKSQWEAPLADGLGDATFRRVDPFTIYPDPFARSPAQLSYIIEARRMTVADAERAWPGAAQLLTNQFLEDMDEAPDRLEDTNRNRPRVTLGPITGGGAPANIPGNQTRVPGTSKFTESPVVTILECYVRGTIAEPDPDDPETVRVRDNWRCIIVCGNAVLVDRPCIEMNAWGGHPYDRLVVCDVGEWYGPCIVELLIPIQRLINWILGSIVRNIYLVGNPQIVEDPRSAATHHRITNRPGQRIPTNPNNIQWMDPPQMHPNMSTELVSYLEGKIETISGLSAMVRGFAPQGRNSQGVLDAVQDAAFVRVRASLRELEHCLRGVASKMAATIAEFYTEPRLAAVIGPGGQQTHLSLRERHFYAIDSEDPTQSIPLRFSIAADSGSSMPTSKQARIAEAKHLFELGAIDILELLKTVEWPNYQLVTQRVMENQAAMAAQAAMAK